MGEWTKVRARNWYACFSVLALPLGGGTREATWAFLHASVSQLVK